MSPVAEVIERDVLRAEIEYEEHIEDDDNPRNHDGVLGVMFTEIRGYALGGEHDHTSTPCFEIDCPRCEGSGEDPGRFEAYRGFRSKVGAGSEAAMRGEAERDPTLIVLAANCARCKGDGQVEVDPVTYFRAEHGARVVLAVDAHIHSDITIKAVDVASRGFSDPWDSGRAGFVCDTEEARERCGCEDWDADQIREAIKAEVEEYDRYLRGEVFHVTVKVGDEVLDSCGGFIGHEYAREQAEDLLTGALEIVEQRREANTIRGEG